MKNQICKVLVCRYDSDEPALPETRRHELIYKCQGKLEVCFVGVTKMVSTKLGSNNEIKEDIMDVDNKRVSEVLKEAALAILVFGGPFSQEITWHPFIAGYVEGRFGDDHKDQYPRIVCIRAEDVQEKQINLLFGADETARFTVPATQQNIRAQLVRLCTDETYSNTLDQLHPTIEKADAAWLEEISAAMVESIVGVDPDQENSQILHGNPTLQFTFARDATGLEPTTQVKASTLHLNRLFKKASGGETTWKEIDGALARLEKKHAGGNFRKWVAELEAAVSDIRENDEPLQMTHAMIGADKHVYRPLIQRYELFDSGRLLIDVNFTARIQDSWLVDASPEIAVAYNLTLAARIRHNIVEQFLPDIARLTESGWDELQKSVDSLTADGFFFRSMAGPALNQALGEDQMKDMVTEFEQNVYTDLSEGIKEKNSTRVASALQNWSRNNLRFFDLALPWYSDQLSRSAGDVSVVSYLRPASSITP
jgi:hypothetical protein